MAITTDDRERVYRRIFEQIPPSFLDPEHPHNRRILGAIAVAVAYVQRQFAVFEAASFIDTASDTEVGPDGLTGLERWGVWLRLPRLPGELPEFYRLRLQRKLFSARLTPNSIIEAVTAATGLACTLELPGEQVMEFDAEDWDAKYLMGTRYAPMSIDVITAGTSDALHAIVPSLIAAGVRWRHIDRDGYEIVLSLGAQQASVMGGVDAARLDPEPFGFNQDPDDETLQPSSPSTSASSTSLDHTIHWGAGTMLILADDVIEAEAGSDDLEDFNWDDSGTLWDESRWFD